MAIPIEKQFVVNAARRDVWAFLTDPSRVAGCLPGASITEQVDERTHAGTIAVKVGPVSARYKGTVRFERLDEEAGEAEIAAAGQDVRGKGGADLRMTSRVVARGPAETEVTVSSAVNITGILAQFGRGIVQDVSDQMFLRFTEAMRAALESAPGRAGADGAAGESSGEHRAIADGPAAAKPTESAGETRPTADGPGARASNRGFPRRPAPGRRGRGPASSRQRCYRRRCSRQRRNRRRFPGGHGGEAGSRSTGAASRLLAGRRRRGRDPLVDSGLRSVPMIPSAFDYHAPGTLDEAVTLLERHGDEAKVLSGGQSLLPLLKLRLGDAGHLVDIGRIPGLTGITEADGYLRIGGATREADLERSDLIREKYPILLDTAVVIADPLVRNRATVGGNLAHGDPANDHPATMLALGGGGGGARSPRRAHHPDHELLHRAVRHRARAGGDPHRDPDSRPSAAQRRRLRQARAQGGGLRHRRRGRAGHARRAG